MAVITDISIPADQFALGRLLDEYPDIAIELDRLVPLREDIISLFWVTGALPEEIEVTVRENQLSEKIHHLTEVDGRSLFEIRWSSDIDALVQPLIDSGADVLRAKGAAGVWEFRLQFRDRVRLATFRESCLDNDIQMQLNALYNPVVPVNRTDSDLTDEQYDIIETAYQQGYWEIPQQITLDELAESIGISTDTASKRLRHGLTSLVDASFQSE